MPGGWSARRIVKISNRVGLSGFLGFVVLPLIVFGVMYPSKPHVKSPEEISLEIKKAADVSASAEAAKEKSNREAMIYATKTLGEARIRLMLKDPDSGRFSGTIGRIVSGDHVACGSVNARNSFGGFTGDTDWLVITELKIAMVRSHENDHSFVNLWNKYCSAPEDKLSKSQDPGQKLH